MSKKLKNVTPGYVPNPYAPEISDEYYINEIIGIEELPYDEFIKDPEPKNHDQGRDTSAQKNFLNAWRGGIR